MHRVAELDEHGVLVGARTVKRLHASHIECGDLPADGRYRWDGRTFIPLGFGKGKPDRAPIDRDRVMFYLVDALTEGKPIPQECRDWARWYKRNVM